MDVAYAVMGGLVLVCLVQAALLWRVFRVVGAVGRADERLAHFGGALALLTETTESGFRAMALEIGRLGKTGGSPASRSSNGRVSRAARRGRTVTEIAAAEDVSEGEVRLRLHLASAANSMQETSNATLRAR
jgi:hypothetical protein